MISTAYYEILQDGLPDKIKVNKIIHGISWTAAVLSDGRCGVAMHTPGETVERMYANLEELPVSEAGKAMLSWNMEEASEALACVNAFYNCPDCGFITENCNALDGYDLSGRTVGMVGHMVGHSGMSEENFRDVKKLYILDREEKPGALLDRACEYYLPLCDLVIITGSAAINKTMPRLLELSMGAEVILTGPSVTCRPELIELGITRLNGRVITQKEEMLDAIVQKRTSVNAYSVPFRCERR